MESNSSSNDGRPPLAGTGTTTSWNSRTEGTCGATGSSWQRADAHVSRVSVSSRSASPSIPRGSRSTTICVQVNACGRSETSTGSGRSRMSASTRVTSSPPISPVSPDPRITRPFPGSPIRILRRHRWVTVDGVYSATAALSEVPKTATYTHDYAQSNGFLTLLSDGTRLTGAYALGPEAGEWMQQATLAIRARVPLDVLLGHHPTVPELLGDLRLRVEGAEHDGGRHATAAETNERSDVQPVRCEGRAPTTSDPGAPPWAGNCAPPCGPWSRDARAPRVRPGTSAKLDTAGRSPDGSIPPG